MSISLNYLRPVSFKYACVPALVAMVAAGSTAVAGVAAEPEPVTACGQAVFGDAWLSADLDCSSAGVVASVAIADGQLDLQGYSITGGEFGVVCAGRCRVINGSVTDADSDGISAGKRLVLDGVSVSRSGRYGIAVSGKAVIIGSSVSNSGRAGIFAKRMQVEGSTIQSNGIAAGERARCGLRAKRVAKLKAGAVVSGNGCGVSARVARVRDSSVINNGAHPDGSPACPDFDVCPDIGTEKRVKLRNSLCGVSRRTKGTGPFLESWGVCSLD